MKKLTFIIIAYNEERNITNCINSILNQSALSNFEIIVVNDGSSDRTNEIVKKLAAKYKEIRLIKLPANLGRGNARYIGVSKAHGEYIAFIDADIVLPKVWLKICLKYLKTFDVVGGIAIPDGDTLYLCKKFNIAPKPVPTITKITGNNSIFKRKIFKNLNFDKSLKGAEDTKLFLQIIKNGFKIKLAVQLIVKHEDDINLYKAIRRIFKYGMGASNLLVKHKIIRLPDISFILFVIIIFYSILLYTIYPYNIILLLLYPLIVSMLFIIKRFYIRKNQINNLFLACLINYILIVSYFAGRIYGIFKSE